MGATGRIVAVEQSPDMLARAQERIVGHGFNVFVWLSARRYVTTFEGFGTPWTNLAALVPDLRVRPVWLGGGYLAWGSVPDAAAQAAASVSAPR